MARLSVSLDADQEAWIEDMKREMGVSKGKVIRECIDEVRTGDSLLTISVQSDEPPDSGRLESLESRLESLEETLRQSTVAAEGESATAGEPDPSTRTVSERESHHTRESHASENVADRESHETTPSTEEPPSTESSEESGDDLQLPGSVLGDIGTSATTDPETSDSDSKGGSSVQDTTSHEQDQELNRPGGDSSRRNSKADDHDATAASGDVISDPQSDDTQSAVDQSASDHPSPQSPTDEQTTSSGGDGTGNTAPRSQPSPSDSPPEEDSIEQYDVDKSDPGAVQERLQEELETSDHATAVFACWTRLRDRGTVHTRAMQALFEDYPLGHDNARDWWRESIQPELVKVPGVQPPEGGGKLYRFSY